MNTTASPVITRKVIHKHTDEAFCTMRVELCGQKFSVTGTAGDVRSAEDARQQAREYWVSYFEHLQTGDQSVPNDALDTLNKWGNEAEKTRWAKGEDIAEVAADVVLRVDGEYHGLDVEREDGDTVWLGNAWGQLDELKEWFPEHAWVLEYNNNTLRPECVHQRARDEIPPLGTVGTPCTTCGHVYGSRWMRHPLPERLLRWLDALDAETVSEVRED